MTQYFNSWLAFLGLAAIAMAGLLVASLLMPETKPGAKPAGRPLMSALGHVWTAPWQGLSDV